MSGRYAAMGRVLAATWPALVVGLAAGATGGVLAAAALDPTPYGRIEYNTVARNAHQAGRTDGWRAAQEVSRRATSQLKEANAEEVSRLEEELEAARADVTTLKGSLARAEKLAEQRRTEYLEVRSSLAESTVALRNATTQQPDDARQQVEGTLTVTRTVPAARAGEAAGCADALRVHGVRVVAGADVTVAVGRLVAAEATKDKARGGTVTLTCSMTYTVDLPTPLGSAYAFEPTGGADGASRSVKVSGSSLEDGAGPALSLTS